MPGVTSDVTALPVTATALPVSVDLNQRDVCSASVLAEHELGCG